MEYNNFRKKELNPAQILAIGFAGIILMGAILLNLPIATLSGKSAGFVNSIFTATSAVCVTGLVVVDTGTFWSIFGKTIILLLIQIGGLGFMSMATLVALIIGRKITLRNRLIMQEAFNQLTLSGIVRLVKYVLVFTLIVEGIGAVLLSLFFVPIYGKSTGIVYGIFHSVSAFCNAGFDLIGNGQSLTPFVTSTYLSLVIIFLIIIGGLGFSVLLDFARVRSFRKLTLHSKLVLTMTAILLSTGFILFLTLEYTNPLTLGNLNFGDKLTAALFQSVTPRTAGFNTIDTASLRDSSKFLTMLLMFIGGSPGSTAGGIKTTTIGMLVLTVVSVIMGREDIELYKRRINKEAINRALTVFIIALSIVLIVTFLLTIIESDKAFIDIIFETISAFGTVGLSTGITGNLSMIGKIIISMTMFAGRVGPITVIVAIAHRNKKKALIRYPEGKISVG
ncbi:MAG: Trk family potassium uptake protein [Clostridiales bacterium]|nr:Trk family potassium uptake protein [Clostridiales bacterium]